MNVGYWVQVTIEIAGADQARRARATLAHAYRFAHVQVDAVGHRVARILCGRPLKPGSDYVAVRGPRLRRDWRSSWSGAGPVTVAGVRRAGVSARPCQPAASRTSPPASRRAGRPRTRDGRRCATRALANGPADARQDVSAALRRAGGRRTARRPRRGGSAAGRRRRRSGPAATAGPARTSGSADRDAASLRRRLGRLGRRTTAAWGRGPQRATPATVASPGLGLEVGMRLPGGAGRRRARLTWAPCTRARQRLRHARAGCGGGARRCGGAGCRPSRRRSACGCSGQRSPAWRRP